VAEIFFRPGVETFEVPAEGGEIQVFYEFDQELQNTGFPGRAQINFNIFFDNTQIELTAQDVTAEAGNIADDFTLGGENDDLAETNEGFSFFIDSIPTPEGEQPFLTIPINPTDDFDRSIINLTTGNPPPGVDELTFANDESSVQLVELTNEPPTVTPPNEPFSYNENQSAGFEIGIVSANDNDGTVESFTIDSGNDQGFFAIDENGLLTLTADGAAAGAAANDFETDPNSFTLSITATDDADATSDPVDVTINVNDIADEQAPQVTPPDPPFSYDENQGEGFEIGTVAAEDNVGVTSFTIASGNDQGFFAIDNNGLLTLTADGAAAGAAANDAETDPNSFTLEITASDDAGNTSDPVNVTVNVNNIDDIDPQVTPPDPPFSYDENQGEGFEIGTVAAEDNVGVTGFTIASGNDQGFFAIDENGLLTLTADGAAAGAAANDAETDPNSFTLGITASDEAGNTSDPVNVTVNVNNIDDINPQVTPPDPPFSYDENQGEGFEIGTVAAEDNVGVTGFTIASGNDQGFFAIDNNGLLTLTADGAAAGAAANDFETDPNSFTLEITASDDAGNTSEPVNVGVNVTNVIEFSLDVDDNGVADPFTDGLTIFRFLDPEVENITDNFRLAPEEDRERSDDEVLQFLNQANENGFLDVDGNGESNTFDGNTIFRFLGELNPETFELGENPTVDPTQVATNLQQFLPEGGLGGLG
jgi:hypothetical protein